MEGGRLTPGILQVMQRREFLKVSLRSLALGYAVSFLPGCGDSQDFGAPQGASGPTGLDTSRSSTTLTEFGSNGFRYGVSPLDNSVTAFDSQNQPLFTLDQNLNLPVAADSDAAGRTYLANYGDSRIEILDRQGLRVGSLGEAEGLLYPSDVAYHPASEELFVADSAGHRILVYGSDGAFLRSFGQLGSAAAEFNSPAAIELDLEGLLWIVDSGNRRLQQVSRQGEPRKQVGTYGKALGQFLSLSGLGLDPTNGELYACDPETGFITVFDAQGEPDFRFRVRGEDGETLISPGEVTVDEENIYIYYEDDAAVFPDPAFEDERIFV